MFRRLQRQMIGHASLVMIVRGISHPTRIGAVSHVHINVARTRSGRATLNFVEQNIFSNLIFDVYVCAKQPVVKGLKRPIVRRHEHRIRLLRLGLLKVVPNLQVFARDVDRVVHDGPRDRLIAARIGERTLVGHVVSRSRQQPGWLELQLR